jgi:PEP-CTERM motif
MGESVGKLSLTVATVLAFFLWVAAPAEGDDISTSIGTQHFANGTTGIKTAAFNTAVAGQPPPFNTFCGSDTASNCSASWTFDYTVPSGDTITTATLTLGILDIDSTAPGNQIASFTLDGTDDLTALLNAASEGVNGGAGSPNNEYNVLSITIPVTDFTDLSGGTATFTLALQGPGLGIIGTTPDNGAGLDFSTLDITATPGSTPPVPEPASSSLFLFGIAAIAAKVALKRFA